MNSTALLFISSTSAGGAREPKNCDARTGPDVVTTDSGNLDPSVVLRAFPDFINADAVKIRKSAEISWKSSRLSSYGHAFAVRSARGRHPLEAVAVDIARVIERGLV